MVKNIIKKLRSAYSRYYKNNFHLKEKKVTNFMKLSSQEWKEIRQFWGKYGVKLYKKPDFWRIA